MGSTSPQTRAPPFPLSLFHWRRLDCIMFLFMGCYSLVFCGGGGDIPGPCPGRAQAGPAGRPKPAGRRLECWAAAHGFSTPSLSSPHLRAGEHIRLISLLDYAGLNSFKRRCYTPRGSSHLTLYSYYTPLNFMEGGGQATRCTRRFCRPTVDSKPPGQGQSER
jgi:hypothetical protein